jgi:hypothetical protein
MTGLQEFPPGAEAPRLAMLRGSLGGVLDTVESVDRIAGATAAARAELIDAARRCSEAIAAESGAGGGSAGLVGSEPHGWDAAVRARRELTFDLAARLRIPERTAETLIGESQRLVQSLPETHRALGAGEISYRHVQAIVDQTAGLSDLVTAEFERTVLPRAKELTVSKFKNDARKKREALDPDSIERRHRVAIEDRNTWIDPQQDGMAILSTLMTAENAVAIMDRITRIALANPDTGTPDGGDGASGDGVKRTLGQRRADAVTDLLLDGDLCETGDPVPHGIRPQVLVTVPVLTLLGQAETPAHLDGYGPISPDTARDLAVKAPSFARILTDPVTSAILDFDRSKYAVPADLKQVVRLQHETCTAPGCNKRAVHCQLDHTQPFNAASGGAGAGAGPGTGTTCLANLSPLCAEHHNLKHHTRIALTKLPDGTMDWTTATGKTVTVRPTNLLGEDMLKRGSPGGRDTNAKGDPDPPDAAWHSTAEPDEYPF